MQLSDLTLFGFLALGGLRVVSYIPQIIRVSRDDNGASAISYSTWSMWTCANVATGLYAIVNLKDLYLAAVSGVYAICCIVVISLTATKRARHRTWQRHAARNEVKDEKRAGFWRSAQHVVADEAARMELGMRASHDFEQRLAAQRNRLLRHDIKMWFR